MNQSNKAPQPYVVDPATLSADSDLQTVLAAWHTATVQLEKTHNALSDEVRRLTEELESKNKELARKNRLADLGRMAAHMAHEVRNSLVPVTLYLSLLKRRTHEDAESTGILDKLGAGFTALEATVHDLLHFTSDHDPKRDSFPAADLLKEIRDALAPQFAAQGIEADLDDRHGLEIVADRGMLRRAMLNLALNAVDAMPHGGRLTLTAEDAAGSVRLSVSDTGKGVDDESGRIFEPFVTGKSGGTGLGLAIVERIAEVHGGTATVRNRPEGGATFTLNLPEASSKKALADKQPVAPKLADKQPVAPKLADKQPVAPKLADKQPVAPKLADKQPVARKLAGEQPVAPTLELPRVSSKEAA